MLLLGRVSAFMAVLPIFSFQAVPVIVRVGLAVMLTIFVAMTVPLKLDVANVHWFSAAMILTQEVLTGLALGLSARLAFTGVQQAGHIASQQMGLTMAEVIDPTSGEESDVVGSFFETCFMVLFLAGGGHHLLLAAMHKSFIYLPTGVSPGLETMVEATIQAGAAMLVFALKLSAPILAAFMMLSVVFALLARLLPEMNVLVEAMPVRVGVGFLMAGLMVPALDSFSSDLATWLDRFLIS